MSYCYYSHNYHVLLLLLVIIGCCCITFASASVIQLEVVEDSNDIHHHDDFMKKNHDHHNRACIDINGVLDPVCVDTHYDNNNNNNNNNDNNDNDDDDDDDDEDDEMPIPPSCRLVMAPSALPDAGWGIFAVSDIRRGQPITPDGDVVIQLTDLNTSQADNSIRFMLHDYLWNSDETGGFYEGQAVVSVIPGIGMLANGLFYRQHNVLPYVPTVDEGGLVRMNSPGAGAISHYHNLTFFAHKDIPAGGELFLNYGTGWYQERRNRLKLDTLAESKALPTARNVQWLQQYGRCLDNLTPIISRIKPPDAGRGAAATRFLPAGAIVAPVPVLSITRRSILDITRIKQDDSIVQTKQLLLNYCFGHPKSSVLLYPYSNIVNFVNHGGKDANVKLQWSKSSVLHSKGMKWLEQNITIDELRQKNESGLLLELVATKPIREGDEILLDYGPDWINAWNQHVQTWKPVPNAESYAPSYVHEDVVKSLRTEAELRSHPYPDNVFTSCFYRYSDNKDAAEQTIEKKKKDAVTTFRWNMTRGIYDYANLRPCSILQRTHTKKKEGTLFTVRIRNRYGLQPNERIPPGNIHIVTHVPRSAVRFSDKLYTTDQHLENAFRHEIGIPDDVFPDQWKDLE